MVPRTMADLTDDERDELREIFDHFDTDGNGVIDLCDIADGTVSDGNGNGVPDSCDLDAGTSIDCNGDGVVDDGSPPLGVEVPQRPAGMTLADLNGDGLDDVIATTHDVIVMLSNGDGSFTTPVVYDGATNPNPTIAVDIDGDLDGWVGGAIALGGGVLAGVVFLAAFYRPPPPTE